MYVPMDPQPDSSRVVAIHTYYTSLKLDKSYKNKVTLIREGGMLSNLALIEYVSKYLGLSVQINAHTKSGRDYKGTAGYVFNELKDFIFKEIPKQIFDK